MPASWTEQLDLFRFAIAAALLAGCVCPLIGTLLWLRRMSFYGITLPQFAAAGVVFGYVVMPWWVSTVGLGGLTLEAALADAHAASNYLLVWAALFSLAGLLGLAALSRRRKGSEAGRVAASFAIANAATFALGRLSPIGKSHVDDLLQGEVLGVGLHEFETIAVVLGLVLLCAWRWRRDLILVAFDREFAQVLGLRVTAIDVGLHVLCAATVGVGTMILGPTMLFGLLVLPPIAARQIASSMDALFLLASVLGAASSIGGILVSFEFDLPLGASVVLAGALTCALTWLLGSRRRIRPR